MLIPAYNEEQTLPATLRSVLEAGIPSKDIYVADDCSTDRTGAAARAAGVRVIRNPANLGKAGSLRRLIRSQRILARYDLVAFLDADTVVASDYFARIRERARADAGAALFVGQVRSLRHNWLTASRAFDYTFMHDIYKSAQSRYSVITVGPGCASVYRAAALRAIELSGDTLAEDMDWTVQIHRKGLGRTVYVPEAIVHTQDPRTLRDYVHQILRWYTGCWQVVRKHRIPLGMQKIDGEMGLLCGEGLVYGALLALAPVVLPALLLLGAKGTALGMLAEPALFSLLAGYSAARNRRADILLYFPLFYITRYLNACVFLQAFYRVYLRREARCPWDRVERYSVG